MQLPLNTQTQDSQKIKLCTFQVCIKLNQSTHNSFDFLRICNNYLQKHYDLYHYNGNEVGERFQGKTVSEKNVEKAREALKIYLTEMDEFQSKILATKRDSAEAYDKMMEDLDNLKGNKKSIKCNRTWSRLSTSMVPNYNVEEAQSDINSKLAENKENMQKVQTELKKLAENQKNMETMQSQMTKCQSELMKVSKTQDLILESLKELSSLHSKK